MLRRVSQFVDLASAVFLVSFLFASAANGFAQRRPGPKSGSAQLAQPNRSGAANQARYKGIFEPVNYPDDLNLHSVFFANENEGWVAADHGTILHTNDGGKSWQAQLGGDVASAEAKIHSLYFLDRRHGWANQESEHALLHTSDGQHWTRTGAFPNGGQHAYAFTSDKTGFYIAGFARQVLQRTTDGGKTWKPVAQCAAKMQIRGLMQNVGCELTTIAFPTANVGYVTGVGAESLFVLKTTDGGATWSVSVVPDMVPGYQTGFHSFFSDEKHGFVALGDGKLLVTNDAGLSWNAVAGVAVRGRINFADPQVGWAFGTYFSELNFTTDGGLNWTTRKLVFPARAVDFSLPKRNVGYMVGEHGMVYRYHVVPVDYKVANGIDAPAMPGSNVALNSQLQRIKTDVAALQVKLGAAGAPSTAATTTAAQPADTSAMPSSSSSSDIPMEGSTSAPVDTGVAASGGDTFTQDLAATQGADFTQDASDPPSPAIQSCCAADIGKLQGDVGSFMQQVPVASGQNRNLNMVIAGARMVSDLFTKSKGFKDAFMNLKKSPNLQSASAALQDLVSKLDGVGQTLGSGFQNPPPLPDFGGGGGTTAVAGQAFSAMSGDGSSTGTAATAPDTTTGGAAATTTDQNKAANQDKSKEIQDKIKKKLKIPF